MLFNMKALRATLEQIEREKKIPREAIIDAIEQSLAAAYKKDYGQRGQVIRCRFDLDSGDMNFFQVKIVVDNETVLFPNEEGEYPEVETTDEETPLTRFNEEQHIHIDHARLIKTGVKVDDEIVFSLETEEDFGRVAAQTAKQVIISRIRDAEKVSILDEYKDRVGEVVNGIVQKVSRGNVFVELGRAIAVIPYNEKIEGEYYRTGQRIKAYLYEVEETGRGIHIKLSRSHPDFVDALFALESPEVATGVVEIKDIAREPGSRTKISVLSHDGDIDPVGACIGQRGIRVNTVKAEISGENIDIIPFSEDPAEYIALALSPARVLGVQIDEEEHTAYVDVADDQLSLAIGKEGQNVRLAHKLTGWKIDIAGVEGDFESTTHFGDEATEGEEEGEYTSLSNLKDVLNQVQEADADVNTEVAAHLDEASEEVVESGEEVAKEVANEEVAVAEVGEEGVDSTENELA